MINKIKELKKEKDAVILAHYYVNGDVQEIADYVGDSFYLAQVAKKIDNKIIIVAGVHFMGESVKILNPSKKVLLVDKNADCPMAHMTKKEDILSKRDQYDDLAVVTYVNSTCEIKALSDVCITSSNAINVVSKLKEENIYIIPDKNLGNYIKEKIPNKNIITCEGYCPVHNKYDKNFILNLKNKYVGAKVLAHPECKKEVVEISDYVGSTSGIIDEAIKSYDKEFIIFTEGGIAHKLNKLKVENKDKVFHFVEDFICDDMKKITMEKLLNVLENEENEVVIDEDLINKARLPLEKMMELGS